MLLAYAEKLTREPAAITDDDIAALRAHGFDDAQLWEATFTAAIFNLFTRMADAFGIAPPSEMTAAIGLDR
jgi:alkylhydroperoxidase family enzyme